VSLSKVSFCFCVWCTLKKSVGIIEQCLALFCEPLNSQDPNTLPHPSSPFFQFLCPSPIILRSECLIFQWDWLPLSKGKKLFLFITRPVTCPLVRGSNFQISVPVYKRWFDFNYIFHWSSSLRAFDSEYMSLVSIAHLHPNWEDICQSPFLTCVYTQRWLFCASLSPCATFLITESLMNLIYSVYREMSNDFNH